VALTPGSSIGSYQIAAQIGAGGMGEVYRATDTKLKRDVAIKVLPEAVAGDADRLARFQREAQVLAALNHPGIAHIYGVEDAPASTSGQPLKALVMELVEGPTLADRVAEGPLPVEDALPIARQIAEALEAAHEQGIIHRESRLLTERGKRTPPDAFDTLLGQRRRELVADRELVVALVPGRRRRDLAQRGRVAAAMEEQLGHAGR
jgi:serine/threonine protein kinase